MIENRRLPTHTQLHLPLVETIAEMGGGKPKDVIQAVAEKINLPEDVKNGKIHIPGYGDCNTWERRVRWVRQQLVIKGYIPKTPFGHWTLTEEGKAHLKNCRPGVLVTVYETANGAVLWAEAQTAAQCVGKSTIQLIFTSPPYPLLKKKEYGNLEGEEYLEWLLDHAKTWKELLKDDGSLVLNLGDVWNRGLPTQNIYQERLLVRLVDKLGYHLAERFYWENPAKIPSSEWVTVRRVRVIPSIEQVLWLGKTPNPYADNRSVLKPYSERMLKLIAGGGEKRARRPSGHGISPVGFSRNNGGSIPHNLLTYANSNSNDEYMRSCRERGLPIHPARFPIELPEFFIKMLSREGDLTADFMSGSLNFAEAAERNGRRFIVSDKSLTYLQGGKTRLEGAPGFLDHINPLGTQDALVTA